MQERRKTSRNQMLTTLGLLVTAGAAGVSAVTARRGDDESLIKFDGLSAHAGTGVLHSTGRSLQQGGTSLVRDTVNAFDNGNNNAAPVYQKIKTILRDLILGSDEHNNNNNGQSNNNGGGNGANGSNNNGGETVSFAGVDQLFTNAVQILQLHDEDILSSKDLIFSSLVAQMIKICKDNNIDLNKVILTESDFINQIEPMIKALDVDAMTQINIANNRFYAGGLRYPESPMDRSIAFSDSRLYNLMDAYSRFIGAVKGKTVSALSGIMAQISDGRGGIVSGSADKFPQSYVADCVGSDDIPECATTKEGCGNNRRGNCR